MSASSSSAESKSAHVVKRKADVNAPRHVVVARKRPTGELEEAKRYEQKLVLDGKVQDSQRLAFAKYPCLFAHWMRHATCDVQAQLGAWEQLRQHPPAHVQLLLHDSSHDEADDSTRRYLMTGAQLLALGPNELFVARSSIDTADLGDALFPRAFKQLGKPRRVSGIDIECPRDSIVTVELYARFDQL